MSHTRIRKLLESGEVTRFHAVPAIRAQTVAAHSWGVGLIIAEICQGAPTVVLLMAGLLHDTGELITGDIPFTAKRGCFAPLRAQMDAAETAAMAEFLWPLPTLDAREETILKLADMLEGLRYATLNEIGEHPLIADRWWSALQGLFCTAEMWSLTEDERQSAYKIYGALSPSYHKHRVQKTFNDFARWQTMKPGEDAEWLKHAKNPPVSDPPRLPTHNTEASFE